MTDTDIARAEELLDPASPSWIGADPDTYLVQPALLWTGRSPARALPMNAVPVRSRK